MSACPFIEAEKRGRRNVKRARAAEGLPCRLLRLPERPVPARPGRRGPGREDPGCA